MSFQESNTKSFYHAELADVVKLAQDPPLTLGMLMIIGLIIIKFHLHLIVVSFDFKYGKAIQNTKYTGRLHVFNLNKADNFFVCVFICIYVCLFVFCNPSAALIYVTNSPMSSIVKARRG